MKKIDIRRIPRLDTRVGVYGSTRQQEVTGAYCMAVVVSVVSG